MLYTLSITSYGKYNLYFFKLKGTLLIKSTIPTAIPICSHAFIKSGLFISIYNNYNCNKN